MINMSVGSVDDEEEQSEHVKEESGEADTREEDWQNYWGKKDFYL